MRFGTRELCETGVPGVAATVVDEELAVAPEFCGKERTESGVRIRGFSEGSERRAYEEDAEVDAEAEADADD